MANRILTRADDNPGEILEDGELHKTGMWEEVTVERSAAGAPGLLFVITRYDGDLIHDRMCVTVPDGAAFLAPVNAWLNGNDPHPYRLPDGSRDTHSEQHEFIDGRVGPRRDFGAVFAPRPGYNQNREDYT